MSATPSRAARRLALTLVGLLSLTTLAPAVALLTPTRALAASGDLAPGGTATVSAAGGVALLRTDPTYLATVLTAVPTGTVVDLTDGPQTSPDGSTWFGVLVGAQAGYLPTSLLTAGGTVTAAGTTTSDSASSPPAATSGGATGSAAATGTGVIAGTNGDGARCRAAASYAGAVITVLPEGAAVTLTGAAVGEWQPLRCAGQDGYVVSQFVSIDGSAPQVSMASAPTAVAGTGDVTPATAQATPATIAAAAVATGYGVVSGTNGAGVRCRGEASLSASTIVVLPEGQEVALTGGPVNGWQPVICAGVNGYVSATYISAGSANPGSGGDAAPTATATAVTATATATTAIGASAADPTTGFATVSGTNGGGLRCRTDASFSASIITVLPDGTRVSLRGAAAGSWQPVVCAGQNGFASSDYLTYDAGVTTPGGGTSTQPGSPGDGTPTGGDVSGTGTVSGTGGDGVRCRTGAGYDQSIITVLPEGTSVSLRGPAVGSWQPVVCAGQNGFIVLDYLTVGGGGGGSTGPTPGGGNGGSTPTPGGGGGATSGTATVSGTNGGGLRCRAGAGYDQATLLVLPEGTVVTLNGAASGEWQPVTCGGQNGWVFASYLTPGGTAGGDSGSTPGGSGTPSGNGGGGSGGLVAGDNAQATANVNLRYDASYSAGVAVVVPSGTVVQITGAAVNGFYPVTWDGLAGYMYGDYLVWTNQPLSTRGGSANPGPTPGGGGTTGGVPSGGGGTATGQAIVNYALQYNGYPYVWGAAGPYAFDCSGLTMWVIQNVLGINITHSLEIQYSMGTKVAYSDLQPGDLVFFQNTYQWGLSHNGIYIGNNQFIHAENETTGVKISDITSDYYASRWYGAVRFS